MRIQWDYVYEADLIIGYDEDIQFQETRGIRFHVGDCDDVEAFGCEEDAEFVDLQFLADKGKLDVRGCILFGVPRDAFTIIEE